MHGEAALHIFMHIVGLYNITLQIMEITEMSYLRVSRNIKIEQNLYENVGEI